MVNLSKRFKIRSHAYINLLLLNTTCPVSVNSVDPDELAFEEANWSGSALFVITYVNFYQNRDQVIWLGGNWKWAWHLNLFSMRKVKIIFWAGTHHFLQDFMCSQRRHRSAFVYAFSEQSHHRMSGKRCRPRSDAAVRGIWFGSTQFAQASLSQYLG